MKGNSMSFYKVVKKTLSNGEVCYRSAVGLPHWKNEIVIYKEGVEVFPKIKNSLLFVFDSYENAIHFMETNYLIDQFEIWECEVTNPRPLEYIAFYFDIYEFWSWTEEMKRFFGSSSPNGTIGVTSVKLIRKIENAPL